MSDTDKINAHVSARYGKEEISDACARVIAAGYHNGQASIGYSFVSTGAIPDMPTDVYTDLFYDGTGKALYESASTDEKRAMNMLGTYLIRKGARGPVAGWSDLWL